jgi:hypothetical protein
MCKALTCVAFATTDSALSEDDTMVFNRSSFSMARYGRSTLHATATTIKPPDDDARDQRHKRSTNAELHDGWIEQAAAAVQADVVDAKVFSFPALKLLLYVLTRAGNNRLRGGVR